MQSDRNDFKLIALDMDGTLLNEKEEISEENYLAIQEAQAKGIHVVLSTGRSILTCEKYAKSLHLSSYLVTVNGSEIWDCSGNLHERNIIHTDLIQMMWEWAKTNETYYWAVATDKVWREQMPDHIFEHKWLKFGFDIKDDSLRETILQRLLSNQQLEVSNSSPTNIEINAAGVNKAVGLFHVCSKLGISMDEVIAMGDSLNDIEMIKAAGCGVAMGNAQNEVKKAADWITATNEDNGVAKAIRYWVLGEH
jgi:phosphoglycolate phosphatase (TIGR01487 family)